MLAELSSGSCAGVQPMQRFAANPIISLNSVESNSMLNQISQMVDLAFIMGYILFL